MIQVPSGACRALPSEDIRSWARTALTSEWLP